MLQKSLALNSSLPQAKYLQLATVRPDGRPANRTVVFRGFLYDTDHLTIVTDRRSCKVSELAANPHVEVCWYFPSSREQYRLSGSMAIVSKDDSNQQLLQARQEAWARMSDAGRSQFVWPQPGQPRMPADEDLFLQPAPDSAGSAAPDFCLGVVQVTEVDHVDLYTNQRRIFSSQLAAVVAAGTPSNGDAPSQPALRWETRNVNP
ncbi:hypothetical protein OEZ86_011056 [Tetradesmus obliquus]|uniref:Uncharacterized protein n=2 Tax=Tetradesmus obliquus TaxID=3088 RepID=A0A383VN95_TETOB|nr:hypothetical protein OEZ85_007891 [Tetradesmus obliquus]WIA28513.1 hypothetical protein OEZ86_011056 [Tetradesmus obliquus]|eukprot:jgi/Sobl393_1/11577/SZX66995.1